MSKQQRTTKPRRKPGLADQPQYQSITWALGVVEGFSVLLTPDYPIEKLILNGIPKLKAVLTDQEPISCEVEGAGYRLTYFAPLNPDERFRQAAEDNAIRNQFGGRLAAAEMFGLREFVPFEWAYYGRNTAETVTLIRTTGAEPLGRFGVPDLVCDNQLGPASEIVCNGNFMIVTFPEAVTNGSTITLPVESALVRDWENGNMSAGSVLVTD